MTSVLDITKQRFGKLVALQFVARVNKQTMWRCICDCGKTVIINSNSLRRGSTRSCGCLQKTTATALCLSRSIHGHNRRGKTSRTYSSWANMRTRCTNPNLLEWSCYGGAGVSCSPRWRNFANFLKDMGERPPHTTLGRYMDMGNYCKSNCAWMTRRQQSAERRKHNQLRKQGQAV